MTDYDFIIAGGGVSGLSLACHLARSPLGDRSILIVERETKDSNDRTLCFWADRPTAFDEAVHRSWSSLRFFGDEFEKIIPLNGYRYRMIRGIDFHRYARRELASLPNVTLWHGNVDRVEDDVDRARLTVDGRTFIGKWVFDSRSPYTTAAPESPRHHDLRQFFKGWLIETSEDAFDTQAVTFLDFRTQQNREMRFFYMLPLTARQALVEYVGLSQEDYDRALAHYVADVLRLRDYRVVASEGGVNPLSDRPFSRRTGRRVMTIGAAGGQVKPTSGYAFTRIQRDSAAIVASLDRHGHPFDVPDASRFYRLCDSLMLYVMQQHSDQMKSIFTSMFRNNPIERIFRFLDEAATPRENLAMMASLPPALFVRAFLRLKVLRAI